MEKSQYLWYFSTIQFRSLKFVFLRRAAKMIKKEADLKAKSPQNQPEKHKKHPYILSILQKIFEKIAKQSQY